MQLDLRRLFEGDEQILPFVFALDLSDVQQWGDRPFQAPVKISGQATNRAGIVTVPGAGGAEKTPGIYPYGGQKAQPAAGR